MYGVVKGLVARYRVDRNDAKGRDPLRRDPCGQTMLSEIRRF
jgi:hypothetical protein